MIRKIRVKFIRIALVVLSVAMVLVTVVVNAANWYFVRAEMLETISTITHNDGKLPVDETLGDRNDATTGKRVSRESQYETRFFSIAYAGDGTYNVIDMAHIASVSESDAVSLAQEAVGTGKTSGFLSGYMFSVRTTGDATIVTFLNCETKLNALRSLAYISGITCLSGILLALLFVALFSKKAIQPLIENVEMQKQFITNAGHELKTPVTVISANMDILSQDLGKNEWVAGTQKQVGLLRKLINELIFLSRMDEAEGNVEQQRFCLSEALVDTASPFVAMAEFEGKALTVVAAPDIWMRGDEGMIRRLISLLLDNAVKYAPENDAIRLALRTDGKRIVLETENALTETMDENALSRLFDRFYRADPARSKENGKGGYGIGLTVAKAIAERHGGEISARIMPSGKIRFVCILQRA